jgi:hypothetical protein
MQRALVVSLAFCLFGGCGGSSGPSRGAVEGKVMLDGVEIEQGSITFKPTGGTQGPTAGGPITKGRYRLSAADGPVVGRHRVEILAPAKSGRKVPAPFGNPGEMTDEVIEKIPARYNVQSILECEVKAGNNTLDFADLTTKTQGK